MDRQLREIAPAVERLFEILDHPDRERTTSMTNSCSRAPALHFDKVSFQYNEDASVLHDFTFSLDEGKVVALVGSSGCGKSTVLKLLCGFIALKAGRSDRRQRYFPIRS